MSKVTELEAQIAEKAGEVASLRSYVEAPATVRIMKFLDDQMQERRLTIVGTPLKCVDDTLHQEFMKGEVSGLYLARNMAQLAFEAAQTDLDRLNKELEIANETEKRDGPDGRDTSGKPRSFVDGPSYTE